MHIKGDLVASGIAAIADDLNVAFLLDGRVGVGGCFAPELNLHNVGFQVIQRQVTVDNGLQLFKQRVVFLGIIGCPFALFLVAVDRDRSLAQDIIFLFHIGGKFRGIFFQVVAQAAIAGGTGTKRRVQKVRHIFALNLQMYHSISSYSVPSV